MSIIAVKMFCNLCGKPANHIVDRSTEGHICLEYRCEKHWEK